MNMEESIVQLAWPGSIADPPKGCDTFRISMIVGTGIDITEIGRIQSSLERFGPRFMNRVYTASEQAYCLRKRNAAESWAARFAAKEAAAKALGTGISRGISWLEIEVVRAPNGRPSIAFHGRAAQFAARLGVQHASISLTHSKTQAMASVILEGSEGATLL